MRVFLPYQAMSDGSKWLTLALLAYLGVVCMVHIDWASAAARAAAATALGRRPAADPGGRAGHHHQPYLFFWQAGQEVEDRQAGAGQPHSAHEVRRHLRRIGSTPSWA